MHGNWCFWVWPCLCVPLLVLSEGGCAGRILSAEEVCWGLGLHGAFCTCFDFPCNGSQKEISCGAKKILLAVAYLDFKTPSRTLQVSRPQFCVAQPQWHSLDVQDCRNGWDKSRQART